MTNTKPRTGLNRSQVREAIANRETFVNSTGSVRGYAFGPGASATWFGTGMLDESETLRFRTDAHFITYVVYSYDTPIAWIAGGTGYRVKQKFSQTTSCHMGLTNFGY